MNECSPSLRGRSDSSIRIRRTLLKRFSELYRVQGRDREAKRLLRESLQTTAHPGVISDDQKRINKNGRPSPSVMPEIYLEFCFEITSAEGFEELDLVRRQ